MIPSMETYFPGSPELAKAVALPDVHLRSIRFWNTRNTGLHLSFPGTSLVLPWYHTGPTLVP